MSRVGEVVASAAALLPGLPAMIALPFIAAASYYLVVVNAPTPVVKERMYETTRQTNRYTFILVKQLILSG